MSTCAICLDTAGLTNLPCGHKFHAACIDEWFRHEVVAARHQSCPVCRTVLIDINPEPPRQDASDEDIRQLTRFFAVFQLMMLLFEVALVGIIDSEQWMTVVQLPIIRFLVGCIIVRHAVTSTQPPLVFASLLTIFPSQCLAIVFTYRDSLALTIVEPFMSIAYLLFHRILLSEWNVNNL